MPAVPSSILEPLWVQFSALLPERRVAYRLGCHRTRIDNQIVFDKQVQMLWFGCSYVEIADHTCSATTLRRRCDEWMALDLFESLAEMVRDAYNRTIGLELEDVAVDGCITKAPCKCAGRSPIDQGKQGLKRSTAVDSRGIPLRVVVANPLLEHRLSTNFPFRRVEIGVGHQYRACGTTDLFYHPV